MNQTMDFALVEKVTKEQLLSDGFIAPKIIYNGGGMLLVYDDEHKEIAIEVARKMVTDLSLDRYWHISECWFVNIEKNDSPMLKPSQRVDRKQAVVISEFNRNLVNKCVLINFDKKNVDGKDIITFGKRTELPIKDSISLWNFFLEKEGIDERMGRMMSDADNKFLSNEADLFMKKFPKDKIKSMSKDEFIFEALEYLSKRAERIDNLRIKGGNKNGL
jgi:hypothetical protein